MLIGDRLAITAASNGSSRGVATPLGELRSATARSPGHHGELLQGSFREGGSLRRALVTLPCGILWSEVTVELRARQDCQLAVRPVWKTKVHRAVTLTLAAISIDGYGGDVVVSSNIAPGRGYGSSTADVTAAIKAVLKAFRHTLPVERIARLTVTAEGASDGTLWSRPVLFSHREGRILEDFRQLLPRMRVLAFDSAVGGSGLDTLALPPARYDPGELDEFMTLRSRLRDALRQRDVQAIGAVATASAQINQRHLPVASFAQLTELARDCGAAGLQVAHSGDVAGMLFETDPRLDCRVEYAQGELSALGLKPWRFVTGGNACGS